MYSMLNELLSDKKGGVTFACFDAWHLCFIAAVFAVIVLLWLFLKNRSTDTKQKTINYCANLAFGLYIADFFLMPFAYGEIQIEKLPFHICTAMCVMCFLSRHTRIFAKYRRQFAIFGLICNFVYLVYPAGVMWHHVHPLSYRVVQTLVFHGVMTVYGFLVIMFDQCDWSNKTWYRDLAVIAAMTSWAMLGNFLYNGECGFFNWFFVVRDPFYLFPEPIAPFLMPPLNMGLFFTVDMLICYVSGNRLRKRNVD